MGDKQERALRVYLDAKLKLEFLGTTITNDAGLLAFGGDAPLLLEPNTLFWYDALKRRASGNCWAL